jgi:predicted nuclease of predicted toxin-antitoxin system
LGINGDIHSKEGRWILVETRFIADVMLGKLATWLRLLGCDVEYLPEISDEDLVEMAYRSGRVILTRDLQLIRRRKARDNHFLGSPTVIWISTGKSRSASPSIRSVVSSRDACDATNC